MAKKTDDLKITDEELKLIQEKIVNYFHNKSSDIGIIVRSQFSQKIKDKSLDKKIK